MRHLQIASKVTAAALIATLLVPVSMFAQTKTDRATGERAAQSQSAPMRLVPAHLPEIEHPSENW
jgi:hypothetical protein